MAMYILWYISINAIILLLSKKEFDYVVNKDIEEDDQYRGAIIFLMVVLALLLLIPLILINTLKEILKLQ